MERVEKEEKLYRNNGERGGRDTETERKCFSHRNIII